MQTPPKPPMPDPKDFEACAKYFDNMIGQIVAALEGGGHRHDTLASAPAVGDLNNGEAVLCSADQKIYFKIAGVLRSVDTTSVP